MFQTSRQLLRYSRIWAVLQIHSFSSRHFHFIQAKAQNAQVVDSKGHTERDTSWDKRAKGGHFRGDDRTGRYCPERCFSGWQQSVHGTGLYGDARGAPMRKVQTWVISNEICIPTAVDINICTYVIILAHCLPSPRDSMIHPTDFELFCNKRRTYEHVTVTNMADIRRYDARSRCF
jgi:hypothetical protein